MRRPRVHRVENDSYQSPVEQHFRIVITPVRYRTRCGMIGGASLMALAATDRGSGHFCNQCWPGSRPIRKQRDVPAGRF